LVRIAIGTWRLEDVAPGTWRAIDVPPSMMQRIKPAENS